MVKNADFYEDKQGNITISSNISIKLCDFGVAEIFAPKKKNSKMKMDGFQCYKDGLTIENEAYLSPKQFDNQKYDARAADIWSLGLILFECLTNTKLYHKVNNVEINGFWAIHADKLMEYIKFNNNLCIHFNKHSLSLLCALLTVDEKSRISGIDILKHSWFKSYFNKYQQQITIKLQKDKKINKTDEFSSCYEL